MLMLPAPKSPSRLLPSKAEPPGEKKPRLVRGFFMPSETSYISVRKHVTHCRYIHHPGNAYDQLR